MRLRRDGPSAVRKDPGQGTTAEHEPFQEDCVASKELKLNCNHQRESSKKQGPLA